MGRNLRYNTSGFITDRSKAVLLFWFILIVNVRSLSVDLMFSLFRIALWSSAGKELPLWLFHLCCFNFSAVLVVRVPFPFGVWGRMWNSIVSVIQHCLFYLLIKVGLCYIEL